MRISLIVADNTVHAGNHAAKVDLSPLANEVRAVQWNWNESQTGHIEMLNGENFEIDAEGFKRFQGYADSADALITAQLALEAARAAELALPRFKTSRTRVGDFDLYRVFADLAGSINYAGEEQDISRSESIRVSLVTAGKRKYESTKGRFEPVVLSVGDCNIDLPDIEADDHYKITALENGTEYHCISRSDLTPFDYELFKCIKGETITVKCGFNAFIVGSEKRIVAASGADISIVASADSFGVFFK